MLSVINHCNSQIKTLKKLDNLHYLQNFWQICASIQLLLVPGKGERKQQDFKSHKMYATVHEYEIFDLGLGIWQKLRHCMKKCNKSLVVKWSRCVVKGCEILQWKHTVCDNGVKESPFPPYRFRGIRHHDIHIKALRPILPQVRSDILIRTSPFLILPAGFPCKPDNTRIMQQIYGYTLLRYC